MCPGGQTGDRERRAQGEEMCWDCRQALGTAPTPCSPAVLSVRPVWAREAGSLALVLSLIKDFRPYLMAACYVSPFPSPPHGGLAPSFDFPSASGRDIYFIKNPLGLSLWASSVVFKGIKISEL